MQKEEARIAKVRFRFCFDNAIGQREDSPFLTCETESRTECCLQTNELAERKERADMDSSNKFVSSKRKQRLPS